MPAVHAQAAQTTAQEHKALRVIIIMHQEVRVTTGIIIAPEALAEKHTAILRRLPAVARADMSAAAAAEHLEAAAPTAEGLMVAIPGHTAATHGIIKAALVALPVIRSADIGASRAIPTQRLGVTA